MVAGDAVEGIDAARAHRPVERGDAGEHDAADEEHGAHGVGHQRESGEHFVHAPKLKGVRLPYKEAVMRDYISVDLSPSER